MNMQRQSHKTLGAGTRREWLLLTVSIYSPLGAAFLAAGRDIVFLQIGCVFTCACYFSLLSAQMESFGNTV